MKFFFVLVLLFIVSCDVDQGREIAERAQRASSVAASIAVPIPTVSYFQEKRTISRWAERWDKPSVPTYVYLLSFGKVLGYYVADGKPASTRSYLMPEENVYAPSGGGWGVTLSSPDIDGTYGENNQGIRFFTAGGVAVEWAGDGASYMYSDAPIDFGYEVRELKK
jgi:hypothetical protein